MAGEGAQNNTPHAPNQDRRDVCAEAEIPGEIRSPIVDSQNHKSQGAPAEVLPHSDNNQNQKSHGAPADPTAPSKTPKSELNVMTLNLQYFSSWPRRVEDTEDAEDVEAKAIDLLREATRVGEAGAADVIAVQEGIETKDVLKDVGYELVVCSAKSGKAQSVREMVYHDKPTLEICPQQYHDEKLCNQIYIRPDSEWKVQGSGVEKISSDCSLEGDNNRKGGKLATRSMVWVKLGRENRESSVYFMCAHFTGGRFEDQYYLQKLWDERYDQPAKCFHRFQEMKRDGDVGILVGDFNAVDEVTDGGPMQAYYNFGIKSSEGVKADMERLNIDAQKAQDLFLQYMRSPFESLRKKDWKFAYGADLGKTSAFGHLIDHMAYSDAKVEVASKPEIRQLTNQKMGKDPRKDEDIELPITDHNAVLVKFLV